VTCCYNLRKISRKNNRRHRPIQYLMPTWNKNFATESHEFPTLMTKIQLYNYKPKRKKYLYKERPEFTRCCRDNATAMLSMRQLNNKSHKHCRMSDKVMYCTPKIARTPKAPLDRMFSWWKFPQSKCTYRCRIILKHVYIKLSPGIMWAKRYPNNTFLGALEPSLIVQQEQMQILQWELC